MESTLYDELLENHVADAPRLDHVSDELLLAVVDLCREGTASLQDISRRKDTLCSRSSLTGIYLRVLFTLLVQMFLNELASVKDGNGGLLDDDFVRLGV